MLQLLLLLILLMLVVVVVIRSMAGDIYSVMSILHAAFLSSLLPARFALAQMTTAWLTMCWPGTPVVISSLSHPYLMSFRRIHQQRYPISL